jgi:hypothetical protein
LRLYPERVETQNPIDGVEFLANHGLISLITLGAVFLIGSGLVQSLSRPGGNVTGLSMMTSDLNSKRLQLLKETAPQEPSPLATPLPPPCRGRDNETVYFPCRKL